MKCFKLALLIIFTLSKLGCAQDKPSYDKRESIINNKDDMNHEQNPEPTDLKAVAEGFFYKTFLPSIKKKDHRFLERFNFLASLDPTTRDFFFDTWSNIAASVEKKEAIVEFIMDDDICEIAITLKRAENPEVFRTNMIFEDGSWVYYED